MFTFNQNSSKDTSFLSCKVQLMQSPVLRLQRVFVLQKPAEIITVAQHIETKHSPKQKIECVHLGTYPQLLSVSFTASRALSQVLKRPSDNALQ